MRQYLKFGAKVQLFFELCKHLGKKKCFLLSKEQKSKGFILLRLFRSHLSKAIYESHQLSIVRRRNCCALHPTLGEELRWEMGRE